MGITIWIRIQVRGLVTRWLRTGETRMPLAGRDVWYMVYGIWYMVYGIWHMVYGIWYMVYGIWYMVHMAESGCQG